MVSSRLTRPNVTWALAYESAFANPAAPTTTELNERRFVHLISCALTEDGTEMTLGDSETDDTLTYCSVGSEVTRTFASVNATLTWLKDANTGGSGSTADNTSLFNKVTSLLGAPDAPYWLIKRVGPNASQDVNFAVGHVIKMAKFTTDLSVLTLEQNRPVRGTQNLLFTGELNYNYTVAA